LHALILIDIKRTSGLLRGRSVHAPSVPSVVDQR
jgi:hypothetical protein